MKSIGKWLVMGGALLILIGFLLPLVTVDKAFLASGPRMSLAQMTFAQGGQLLLFVVPLGMIVTLVAAFLPSKTRSMFFLFLAGELAGLALGLLGLLLAVFYIYSQAQQAGGLSVTPGFGVFVLVLGFGLAAVGIVLRVLEGLKLAKPAAAGADAGSPAEAAPLPKTAVPSGARLEVIKGPLANRAFHMNKDSFTIGRGAGNDLQVSDKRVSRQHARLKRGQGEWFLQDQNSAGGTKVNGKNVTATRITDGDQITIGDTTLVFHK